MTEQNYDTYKDRLDDEFVKGYEEQNEKIKIIAGLKEINRRKKAGLTLNRKKVLSSFEWSCEGQITIDEAQTLMRKSGYDPAGYGFWGYRFTDGKTEWQSSNKS